MVALILAVVLALGLGTHIKGEAVSAALRGTKPRVLGMTDEQVLQHEYDQQLNHPEVIFDTSNGQEQVSLFESDIVLTKAEIGAAYGKGMVDDLSRDGFIFSPPFEENSTSQNGRQLALKRDLRWPTRDPSTGRVVLAVEIDDNDAHLQGLAAEQIAKVMATIESETGVVKFVRRTNEKSYVKIIAVDKAACYANVGYLDVEGYYAKINLGWCNTNYGSIIHEFLHVLGMWHEQSRPDRDNYIKINYENVMDGKASRFAKLNPDLVDALGSAYDYESIMHYGPNAHSKLGASGPTIEAPVPIGFRSEMSEKDIEQVRLLYQCISGPRSLPIASNDYCTADCPCWVGHPESCQSDDSCQGALYCNTATRKCQRPGTAPTPAPTSKAPATFVPTTRRPTPPVRTPTSRPTRYPTFSPTSIVSPTVSGSSDGSGGGFMDGNTTMYGVGAVVGVLLLGGFLVYSSRKKSGDPIIDDPFYPDNPTMNNPKFVPGAPQETMVSIQTPIVQEHTMHVQQPQPENVRDWQAPQEIMPAPAQKARRERKQRHDPYAGTEKQKHSSRQDRKVAPKSDQHNLPKPRPENKNHRDRHRDRRHKDKQATKNKPQDNDRDRGNRSADKGATNDKHHNHDCDRDRRRNDKEQATTRDRHRNHDGDRHNRNRNRHGKAAKAKQAKG